MFRQPLSRTYNALLKNENAMNAINAFNTFSNRGFKIHMKTQKKTRKQGKTYPRHILSPTRRLKFPAWRERPVEPDRTENIEKTERRTLEIMRTEVDPRFMSNATSDDYLNFNHSWAKFFHRVAQSVPRSLLSNPTSPKLPDSWFTRSFPGYELGKPSWDVESQLNSKINMDRWRRGFTSLQSQGKFFDKYNPSLQQFNTQDKPLNPFRYKPQLINRISVKNPKILFPFISETGKIKSRNYTGLKNRAQRRVTREIKKLRILGLTGYGSNPEYGKDHSQPMASFMGFNDFIESINALENHEKRKRNREYKLTESKIIWERDFETRKQLNREYLGITDAQIERKKREIKHLVMENEYLKTLGNYTPIEKYSDVGKIKIDDLTVDKTTNPFDMEAQH